MNADTKMALLLVALVATVGGYLAWRGHERQVGRLLVETATLRAENQSLTRRSDSLEKAYHIDTVVLDRIRTHWDTVKAGIDTLRDSVKVPVEVVRIVERTADSTIHACQSALGTCEAIAAVARQRLAVADSMAKATQTLTPGFWSRHASLTLGVGVLRSPDGTVRAGPALVAGWRFWP